MTTPTLTRTAFTAWLAQWPDNATIGIPNNGNACPIACFLHEQGMRHAFVDGTEILVDWDEPEVVEPLPEWSQAFVAFVDDCEANITPALAREILARIPDDSEVLP